MLVVLEIWVIESSSCVICCVIVSDLKLKRNKILNGSSLHDVFVGKNQVLAHAWPLK